MILYSLYYVYENTNNISFKSLSGYILLGSSLQTVAQYSRFELIITF